MPQKRDYWDSPAGCLGFLLILFIQRPCPMRQQRTERYNLFRSGVVTASQQRYDSQTKTKQGGVARVTKSWKICQKWLVKNQLFPTILNKQLGLTFILILASFSELAPGLRSIQIILALGKLGFGSFALFPIFLLPFFWSISLSCFSFLEISIHHNYSTSKEYRTHWAFVIESNDRLSSC